MDPPSTKLPLVELVLPIRQLTSLPLFQNHMVPYNQLFMRLRNLCVLGKNGSLQNFIYVGTCTNMYVRMCGSIWGIAMHIFTIDVIIIHYANYMRIFVQFQVYFAMVIT